MKRYLDASIPERRELKETLGEISAQLPDTVIFGGMLRDLALTGARSFCSDIDLVSRCSDAEIHRAISKFHPTRNKFGGYRFVVGHWRFDLWSFQNTWAFQKGCVRGAAIEDLCKTTFFNVDAMIYGLSDSKLKLSPSCKTGLSRRLLEINLPDNPAPMSMVHRAIRLACSNGFSIGPRLTQFLLSHSPDQLSPLETAFLRDLRIHESSSSRAPFRFKPQVDLSVDASQVA